MTEGPEQTPAFRSYDRERAEVERLIGEPVGGPVESSY
jgi:hypothetical protein